MDWSFIGLVLVINLILNCEGDANVKDKNLSISKAGLACWMVEKYVVVQSCQKCKAFEKNTIPGCTETGFKQHIRCTESNTTLFISCSGVKSIEERKFWIFEACVAATMLLSNIAVWVRRRKLDHYAYVRLQKQMSDAGV